MSETDSMEFAPPWPARYEEKKRPVRRALKGIRRGSRIFIGSASGEPQILVRELERIIPELADLEILQVLSLGRHAFLDECFHDKCRLKSFFVAAATRQAVAEGRADYTPINLADIPDLFRKGLMPVDVALIQVSPPDDHGFCSFGIAVDIVKAAAESASHVVAQVNPLMPRTLGDSFVHVDCFDAVVEHEEPLLEMSPPRITEVARAVGRQVARLVDDGATLRVGVGSIPGAILEALEGKKDLGVHTDMLTDPYLRLVEKGVITNARKTLHPGKIVASFCLGSRALYDFVDDNPMVALYPVEYTNNYLIISQNDKMVSVNSALEVDLTGQVCSDSLGYEIFSGIGGSVDFLRGARNSRGGKAIVALTSTSFDGTRSRIVASLTEGGGVVTTRGGVQYVVTEYGIAQLHGRSIRERTLALVEIAHPDFREALMREAYGLHFLRREWVSVPKKVPRLARKWEVDQVFDEKVRVRFRPVQPTDEAAIQEFFHALPKEGNYIRFLSTMKVFPRHDIRRFVQPDYTKETILVGLLNDTNSLRVVALGRYVVDEETLEAEIDFAVLPQYGGMGIASFLVQRLAEIAKANDVRLFKAYLTEGNEKVFGIFQKLGYLVETSYLEEGRFFEVRVDLHRPVPSCLVEKERVV